jgi:hypothetical protein
MSSTPLDYFEAYKNNGQTNELDWLNKSIFASYGIVVDVIDINTVVAVSAADDTKFVQPVTLTLLRPSSALFERATEPVVGDRVIMLPLSVKALGMFDSDKPVVDKNAAAPGVFSSVGILLSTFKGASATTVLHGREDENYVTRLESAAVVSLLLGRALKAVFNSISGDEELVKLVFGGLSPLLVEHRAAVDRNYGFDADAEGKETTVPAPVTERYSVDAPVKKSFQGPLAIEAGIDGEGNPTEAPINVSIGEKSDITLSSASGMTLSFDKAVSIATQEGFEWTIAGDLTIKVDGKVNIESAGCLINNVLEVK